MTAYQNARCYWEMYGGLPPETTDRYIHAFDIWLDIGGHKAADYPDYYQVSVYGRKTVDSPNRVTLYRESISGTSTWRHVHIAESNSDNDVRCIVLRVEAKVETVPATTTTYEKGYDDQYDTADTPPWGVRITDYAIYCTSLERDIRLHRVLDDIIDNRGFAYSGPNVEWEPDQLAFTDVPKDRWDGLDDVNGMLGYNYHCWDGTNVVFSAPKSGTAHEIDEPCLGNLAPGAALRGAGVVAVKEHGLFRDADTEPVEQVAGGRGGGAADSEAAAGGGILDVVVPQHLDADGAGVEADGVGALDRQRRHAEDVVLVDEEVGAARPAEGALVVVAEVHDVLRGQTDRALGQGRGGAVVDRDGPRPRGTGERGQVVAERGGGPAFADVRVAHAVDGVSNLGALTKAPSPRSRGPRR